MTARAMKRLSDVLAAGLILLVRLYQASLSPLIGRQCRFVPTCSSYFIEAVRKHGPLRGFLMGTWRICRCNPFCRGGYDPVDGRGGPR
jgi:putative membrane protein insertion efficiency factor